jgi:hypothetical protein
MRPEEKANYEKEYVELLMESNFILCPRGIGPCTYRLFESMQLGRAPVIIADDWQEIPNIPWSTFSIRVPEAEVDQIAYILRERSADARSLGLTARRVWEEAFAPSAALKVLATAALELVQRHYGIVEELSDLCQFRHPWHFRNLMRYYRNRMRARHGLTGQQD